MFHDEIRAVSWFDLSSLPAGAEIVEATLSVFVFWVNELAHDGLACTALTSGWDVETVESSFPEFDPEPFDEIADDPDESTYTFDVTTMIEEIVELGEPNHGFMFYFPDGEPTHELWILSCDYYQTNGRPKLTIEYVEPE